jgi:Zn-dependent M28 family amino/carboxypeptidase
LLSPGADDNASGTAGVIEIARVLSKHKFKRTIIYLNNNGEEVGLEGSTIFAYYCRQNNINILCVFNLDMIGYNSIDEPLRIFYDNLPLINKDFAKYFGEVANLYLLEIPVLPPQFPIDISRNYIGRGDDISFIHNNYPAMYIGESLPSVNSCYHRSCDTIGIGKEDAGVNSMELVRAYTQATLAAIAELAELDVSFITEESPINCTVNPNPTNETTTITLYFNDVGNLSITLNNMLGQEIMKLHNAFVDTKILTKKLTLSHLSQGL